MSHPFLLFTSSIICLHCPTCDGLINVRGPLSVPPLFIRLLPNYPLAVQRRRTSVPTTFIRKKAYYQKKDKRGSSSFPHLSLSALPCPTCDGLINVRDTSENECTRTSVTCRARGAFLIMTAVYLHQNFNSTLHPHLSLSALPCPTRDRLINVRA